MHKTHSVSLLSGGITATQGLINNDFSWSSLGLSMAFGAVGGALGTTSWGKGARNVVMGAGLGIAEGFMGELIEWVLSQGDPIITAMLRYRLAN